jgi:hypothetical protein
VKSEIVAVFVYHEVVVEILMAGPLNMRGCLTTDGCSESGESATRQRSSLGSCSSTMDNNTGREHRRQLLRWKGWARGGDIGGGHS